MNLGVLLNRTHLGTATLLNMTLPRSRGTGEPWDTAEPDSPGFSDTAEHDSSVFIDPGVLLNLTQLDPAQMNLTHLDPALLNLSPWIQGHCRILLTWIQHK